MPLEVEDALRAVSRNLDATLLAVRSSGVAEDTTYSAGDTATIADVGTLVINSDGSYTFTPEADWHGDVPQATYTTNLGETDTSYNFV